MPQHINADSKAIDFLDLFLGYDSWELLCSQTSLQATQEKEDKPTSYYAKPFKPVDQDEMKAFVALRLQMENSVVKQRYEHYWQGSGMNFLACTPGFR